MLDISEIFLFVSDSQDVIQEISFTNPLKTKKWVYLPSKQVPKDPSVFNRLKTILLKCLRWMLPRHKKNQDLIFKTALAQLLIQPSWQALGRRKKLLQAAKAMSIGTGSQNQENLMDLDSTHLDLSVKQLARQALIVGEESIKQMQCLLLDEIERQPVQSSLHVLSQGHKLNFDLETRYSKYKVHTIDPEGNIMFHSHQNKGTCCVQTKQSIFPDLRGVIGQRLVYSKDKKLIGSYSGELTTHKHVLEQILCLLNVPDQPIKLSSYCLENEVVTILFTSLYAWHELDCINRQKQAIAALNNTALILHDKTINLKLLYINIPFNRWNKLPAPSETKAVMQDCNEEALIWLTYLTFCQLGLSTHLLDRLVSQLNGPESDFFKFEGKRLKIIDTFKNYKPSIISILQVYHTPIAKLLKCILQEKCLDGQALKGMDFLIYLEQISQLLNIKHHKNCYESLHRSCAAEAADKAQHIFTQLTKKPFLPSENTEEEDKLFRTLYTLYLLWEEPEVHTLLSTGDSNLFLTGFKKHPEINRYLAA